MPRLWKLLLAAGLLNILAFPLAAAPDKKSDEADIDEEDEDADLPRNAPKRQSESSQPLVEVARGVFVQADPGVFDYLGLFSQGSGYLYNFGQALSWGPSLRLHVGGDVVTRDHFGLSIQGTLWQVINNGIAYTPPLAPVSPAQGDTRSFFIEAAARPTWFLGSSRRLNLFIRFGGGVGILEQEMSEVPQAGIYSSMQYGIAPKPFVSGGAGLEYYTRLSHFSFTFLELNALYVVGLDVAFGVNFAGFKYTF